jgi:GNAT superfamily N-acetyltransferase
MTRSGVTFRAAVHSDLDILLPLMHCLQQDDPWSVPFHEERVRDTVRELLASPSAGCAFLIFQDELCIGYLVLSFDFSIEYGGKNAWIDELFVQREYRGRGVGSRAIDFAIQTTRQFGATVLHLEVNRGNPAIDLYRRFGFEDHDRRLLSKRIL